MSLLSFHFLVWASESCLVSWQNILEMRRVYFHGSLTEGFLRRFKEIRRGGAESNLVAQICKHRTFSQETEVFMFHGKLKVKIKHIIFGKVEF